MDTVTRFFGTLAAAAATRRGVPVARARAARPPAPTAASIGTVTAAPRCATTVEDPARRVCFGVAFATGPRAVFAEARSPGEATFSAAVLAAVAFFGAGAFLAPAFFAADALAPPTLFAAGAFTAPALFAPEAFTAGAFTTPALFAAGFSAAGAFTADAFITPRLFAAGFFAAGAFTADAFITPRLFAAGLSAAGAFTVEAFTEAVLALFAGATFTPLVRLAAVFGTSAFLDASGFAPPGFFVTIAFTVPAPADFLVPAVLPAAAAGLEPIALPTDATLVTAPARADPPLPTEPARADPASPAEPTAPARADPVLVAARAGTTRAGTVLVAATARPVPLLAVATLGVARCLAILALAAFFAGPALLVVPAPTARPAGLPPTGSEAARGATVLFAAAFRAVAPVPAVVVFPAGTAGCFAALAVRPVPALEAWAATVDAPFAPRAFTAGALRPVRAAVAAGFVSGAVPGLSVLFVPRPEPAVGWAAPAFRGLTMASPVRVAAAGAWRRVAGSAVDRVVAPVAVRLPVPEGVFLGLGLLGAFLAAGIEVFLLAE
ncbi:hypothetical protein [Actinoplanes sp. NPDC049802]|uniref:hypothetical protein n=1 Tax=Actinoplanes sp. NPDC049802 TaxID=3154742 RepID=UPI0033C5A4BE